MDFSSKDDGGRSRSPELTSWTASRKQREQLEVGEVSKLSEPARHYAALCKPAQTAPPTGDRVFTRMSPWEAFSFKASERFCLFLDRVLVCILGCLGTYSLSQPRAGSHPAI